MADHSLSYATLQNQVEQTGLSLRALCTAQVDDNFLPASTKTVALLGFAGSAGWRNFAEAPEAADEADHPLDRWSKRVIGGLAQRLNATPLFPSDGPPYVPFQQLALRSGRMFASPIGLLIDPHYGLWHSFRGALAFPDTIELPQTKIEASPCESCIEKPCLSSCPVNAFNGTGYDVSRCAAHLYKVGETCTSDGCLARLGCPVGTQHHYQPEQMRFYMTAFKRAHHPS